MTGLLSEDCVLQFEGTARLVGRTGPYIGHDGLQDYLQDVDQVWDELVLHAHDFRAVPGSVIVMGHITGQRQGSGRSPLLGMDLESGAWPRNVGQGRRFRRYVLRPTNLLVRAMTYGAAGDRTDARCGSRRSSDAPKPAAASQPLSPRSIIKRLNTERARQGLPSTVQEVPLWSDRCASHNHWMSLNDVAQHDEPPGSEGYSEAGDWAGSNSVLAQGTTWRDGNPCRNAPLHLMQLFNPDLRRAGASDAYNSTCITTWPGTTERRGRRVWTMPRDNGRVATSQLAWEAPFTPQERVGIAADTRTGPYLYVWSDGYTALVDGSLTDPEGTIVDTR